MPKLKFLLAPVLAFVGLFATPAFADHLRPWGIWTQDPVTPVMEQITSLHNTLTVIIALIVLFVFGLLGYICIRFHASRNPTPATFTHNAKLEIVWTLLPVVILVVIAFPSYRLLYAMDKATNAEYTLKVTGHQWFWSYSYPDLNVAFDSNIVPDKEPHQLATDNPVVLPVGAVIRIQVIGDDVIHSWAVPAFGVKIDAVPGRLAETWTRIDKPGTYYGQCSQLCGINHGFMPIEVKAVSKDEFKAWIAEHQGKQATLTPAVHLADARN